MLHYFIILEHVHVDLLTFLNIYFDANNNTKNGIRERSQTGCGLQVNNYVSKVWPKIYKMY